MKFLLIRHQTSAIHIFRVETKGESKWFFRCEISTQTKFYPRNQLTWPWFWNGSKKKVFFSILEHQKKIKNFEPWLLLTASFPSSIPSQLFATEQFEFEVNTNFIQFFDANDRLEFIWDFGDGDSPRQGFKNYPCWGRRGQIDLTIEFFGVQNPLNF